MSTKPIFFLSLYLLLWYLLLCLAVYLFSGVIFTQTRVSQTQMLQAQAQTQMLQARVPQTQVPQTQVLQVQAHAQTQEVQEAESTYARLPIRQIEIRTDSANNSKLIARFKVEIADTPQAQRRGLMFRTKMPANEGMLFIFPYPRVASFWMRNTILPLDMIFIKADGMIETIVTRRDTGSDKSTRSQSEVAYVLELNAGTAAAHGIKVGQKVHIKASPQREGGL